MKRLLLILALLLAAVASGHEMRPSYLEITETEPAVYQVIWKVPARGELRLSLDVAFDDATRVVVPPTDHLVSNSHVRRWKIRRDGGLDGSHVRLLGLNKTFTDALVRITHLDGRKASFRVAPDKPDFVVEANPGWLQHATTYTVFGIKHILLGFDHLLFVFGLVLLVKGWRKLVGTITSFTIAHSITLAAATLGFVHVPQAPVDACVALSIVFVATEVVHARTGRRGITERWPWIVAFSFGLLHGLGFASALTAVGIPQQAVPIALLFFNVGVEIGQLAFIAAALPLVALIRRLPDPSWEARVAPYAIGSVAAFLLIERTASFLP